MFNFVILYQIFVAMFWWGELERNVVHVYVVQHVFKVRENIWTTRVGLNFVTIQNRILKLNFKLLIWIKVSDFNLNQFVLVFKSAVKIWAKLNIRNLVKNYPVLQVRSWICGGQGSWLVLKSFSLGQESLLWKFELNWMSGCWEKFVWWVQVQVLLSLDFRLLTFDLDLDCDNFFCFLF